MGVLNTKRCISVVLPTRDRAQTLRQALTSIRALEAEDLTFEILVGDNGDDPRTKDACEAFGARHLPVPEAGAGAARNAGLEAATGEFIAFLDDDDVWMPNHVRPHLKVFDARPEVEAVMARVVPVDDELRELGSVWPKTVCAEGDESVRTMLSGYYPQIGATIVRHSVRDAVGPFDTALLGDQDWDWQLRVARRRNTAYIADPCVLFRQRPAGSFDALRFRRLGFGRRVFLRHALPEWRVWPSLGALLDSYRDMLWQYYEYFVNAASERADNGERAGAWRAIWGAWRTFPLRASYQLIAPKPLRRALVSTLFQRRRRPVANGA